MSNVIWFTGLSGSGKSTLASALKKKLEEIGKTVEILDGDVVREKLHKHLGFSREDIRENNRLIAELAKKSNLDIVLVPIISPYREDRKMARAIIGTPLIELYVNAPLEECLKRDPKGLYRKAQAGETDIIGFVGSNPYEAPEKPDLEVDTKNNSVEENVEEIMTLLFLPFDAMDETKSALKAALNAGKAVLGVYNSDFSSEMRDGEPLTEADGLSDAIIKKILTPYGHPILSEESEDDEQRLKSNRVWIIDPLDGTSDFVDKNGEFTIMIGLVERHRPIMGVIYQPTTHVLYVAEQGKGAYKKNGAWQRLRVSGQSNVHHSRVLMSRHHLSEKEKAFLKRLGLNYTSRGSSLKAMAIACGGAELYFTLTSKINQWDTCASCVILHEAGGKMTDVNGNEFIYNAEHIHHENGVLASNGKVHIELIQKYGEFNDEKS